MPKLRETDVHLPSSVQVDDGLLWLLETETENYAGNIDFGNVNPDDEAKTLNYSIANIGDEPAILEQVSLIGDTDRFSLENLPENIELQPGETRENCRNFRPYSYRRSHC